MVKTAVVAGVTAALLGAGVAAAGAASADPITCPNGQTSAQTAPGVWACVNNGGQTSNADETRNPTD